MKRLLAALATCAASATAAYGDDTLNVRPFQVKIEPKQMHEECVKLQAGEKRNYYWKADNAVDFNIHYHDGPEVFYPVKRDGMRGDGGSFVAKIGQDY